MKLVAMATLASAFLLQLLAPCYEPLRLWLLRTFCHRTGWHLRLSSSSHSIACVLPRDRLWQRYPPCFAALGRPPRGQGLLALT